MTLLQVKNVVTKTAMYTGKPAGINQNQTAARLGCSYLQLYTCLQHIIFHAVHHHHMAFAIVFTLSIHT